MRLVLHYDHPPQKRKKRHCKVEVQKAKSRRHRKRRLNPWISQALPAINCHKKITIKGLRGGLEPTKIRVWNFSSFWLVRDRQDTRGLESQVEGCLKSGRYFSFCSLCFWESQVGPGWRKRKTTPTHLLKSSRSQRQQARIRTSRPQGGRNCFDKEAVKHSITEWSRRLQKLGILRASFLILP